MKSQLRLRKATEKDLPQIQQTLQDNELCFEDVPQILGDISVAYLSAEVIGFGGVEPHGECGLLRSIVILPPFRNQGLGRALCTELIRHATRQNLHELYLLTLTAEIFFDQMGFKKIPRDEAPAAMQETTEFKDLCPVSSVCMRLKLSQR